MLESGGLMRLLRRMVKSGRALTAGVAMVIVVLLCMAADPAHAGLAVYPSRGGGSRGIGPTLWLDIGSGEKLIVEFIHSALKSPVREIYLMDDDVGLVLVEAVYQSLGFGMPFDTPERFSEENGRYHLRGINWTIGALDLRIGEIAEQTLSVNGRVLRLLDHYSRGTLVRIEVFKQSIISK
jgi:hypothetical protein